MAPPVPIPSARAHSHRTGRRTRGAQRMASLVRVPSVSPHLRGPLSQSSTGGPSDGAAGACPLRLSPLAILLGFLWRATLSPSPWHVTLHTPFSACIVLPPTPAVLSLACKVHDTPCSAQSRSTKRTPHIAAAPLPMCTFSVSIVRWDVLGVLSRNAETEASCAERPHGGPLLVPC
jgi:hypothetical protein